MADTLVLARGGRTVVDRLSFTVDAGHALVLSGANGAGKTTLIRALAGFLLPVEGQIVLEGGSADRTPAEQCHFVGHQNGMKSSLTVEENLLFWADFLRAPGAGPGVEPPKRVADALTRFDLEPLSDIPAGYLSAGQKRRLGLARLLVAERPVWLLDEPTVSLDTRSAGLLAALVNAHTAAGGIVVAATHLDLGLDRADELRLGPREVAA